MSKKGIGDLIVVLTMLLYAVLFVALTYLITGCSVFNGLIDFSEDREITVIEGTTTVTIKGDIYGAEDYPQVHKIIDHIRRRSK